MTVPERATTFATEGRMHDLVRTNRGPLEAPHRTSTAWIHGYQHYYIGFAGIKMQPESEIPVNGRTDGTGCGLGAAVSLVTEDGRCGFVGKEPRGGQPIPPDRRNPGPPSRAIPNRAWRYMKQMSGNGRSRRNRATSHSEPEMIRLFPRQCVIHGIETSSTDSCRSADRRPASGPLRLAGWHTHGSDDTQMGQEV